MAKFRDTVILHDVWKLVLNGREGFLTWAYTFIGVA
jgi:hypothetical protein